ncbi:Flp1 family type IVb pilin [Blautia sp.]|uniref:Flp1 family type IVb pilin n=1 Tax=Blautia sp. TaxID=1955243 RepID=UPI00280B7910|nr:Flp1 family type IVb pilin [Blautia sp.]MDY3015880.1 Flp1 family type IVb pilin [Blautia sp.]
MMKKIDRMWIGIQNRMRNFWEDFKTEEKGAAEIVAIILVIVVVIAAAVVFKDKIVNIVESVMEKAEGFAGS